MLHSQWVAVGGILALIATFLIPLKSGINRNMCKEGQTAPFYVKFVYLYIFAGMFFTVKTIVNTINNTLAKGIAGTNTNTFMTILFTVYCIH